MAAKRSSMAQALRCSCFMRTRGKVRPYQSSRAFTASASRRKHGPIATFSPTSSEELDAIFATFRARTFLPAHLPLRQRALIYKRKYKSMLENDPFMVEVGDEKFQLQHASRLDEPSTRKSFMRMLDLLKEPRDWENVPAFLEELQNAKRKVWKDQLEKMIRRANEAGMQGAVIECAKRVAKTGLTLRDLDIVREAMWGAHLRGVQGNWDAKAATKALNHAEYVALLLEDPLHSGGSELREHDARIQPDIVGVLLETAAIRALKHQAGRDDNGKVALYAQRLMHTWPNATFAPLLQQTTTAATTTANNNNTTVPSRSAAWQANRELQRWAPVWKGISTAAKILPPPPVSDKSSSDPAAILTNWFRTTIPALVDVLAQARRVLDQPSPSPSSSSSSVQTATPKTEKPRGLQWLEHLRRI